MTKADTAPVSFEPRVTRFAFALALLSVLVTFAPTIRYGFVDWDDTVYVTENPAVVGAPGAVDVADRLLTPGLGYPAPLTVATFTLEHALFGLRPAIYHLTNVALHLAACALLFAVARQIGLGVGAAVFAVLVFGLHPVVAEPVSWISGRKDLLAGVFCLSATLAFLRDDEPKGARAVLPAVLFLLGALSKPTALFLPPLLFCLHCLLRRRGVWSAARAVLPLLPILGVVFFVSLLGQQAVHAVRESTGTSSVVREAWYALGFHLGLLFFVQTPCVKHFPAQWPLRFEPAVDLLPLGVLALGVLGWFVLRSDSLERRRAFGAGLAWAGLAYLPSSSLIPLTRYLADSYVYLPLAGVALALAVFVDRLEFRLDSPTMRVVMTAAAFVGAMGLAVEARGASRHWSDDVALWGHAYRRYPNEYRICRNLGNAYVAAGDAAHALELYENCATRLTRQPFQKNIAVALFLLGRRDEARQAFLQIYRETPEDPVVRRYLSRLSVLPSE